MTQHSWKTAFWTFIHTLALQPMIHHGNQADICRAFESLEHLIPCSQYKSHFVEFKNMNDIVTYMQEDEYMGVFKWTVDLHNMINREMGAPTLSYKEALSVWTGDAMMEP